jgi:hypothetical protein
MYTKSQAAQLRYRFPGCETIDHSWSQAGQDIFVLSMFNGMREGTYLEIGSCFGEDLNNTCILERNFGWRGTGIDIDREFVADYNSNRTNKSVQGDALQADYVQMLKDAGIDSLDIDYLSCDCEPPTVTFAALQRVIEQGLRFGVITFEHDCYVNGPEIRDKSREYLRSKGYVLVVSNISANPYEVRTGPVENYPDWHSNHLSQNFEDWWVDPNKIDPAFIELFKANDDTVKPWRQYIIPYL